MLTVYNAYCAWRRICESSSASEWKNSRKLQGVTMEKSLISEYQFCRKNFLSPQTLSNIEDLKAQLMTSLVDADIIRVNDAEKLALYR